MLNYKLPYPVTRATSGDRSRQLTLHGAADTRRTARLSSWKEIAAYLGRDARTVQRWEYTRTLPVRRVPGGRSKVYALTDELDAWLRSGKLDAEPDNEKPSYASELAPDPAMMAPARPNGQTQDSPRGRWPRTFRLQRAATVVAIASLVVLMLGLGFWTQTRRVASVAGASHAGSDWYSKGMFAWRSRTRAGLNDAVADFSQAILLNPDDARAYVGLADCYILLPEFGAAAPAQAFAQAKVAAQRAMALEPNLADAHSALGFVDFWWSHDVAGSRREFERAVQLDPRSALAHHWYANILTMTRDFDRALAEIGLAEALDPGQTAVLADKAVVLFDAGKFEQAYDILHAVESARPDYGATHQYLAAMLLSRGEISQGLRELLWAAKLSASPEGVLVADAALQGYRQGGRAGMLRRKLQQQEVLFREGRYSPYALAESTAAGDVGRTLSLLEQSRRQGEPLVMAVGIDVNFGPLHDDARFRAFMHRLGLPPLGA